MITSDVEVKDFDISTFLDFEGGEKRYQAKLKTDIIQKEKERFSLAREIEELRRKKRQQTKEMNKIKEQQSFIPNNQRFGLVYENNSCPMLLSTCGDGFGALLSWNR